MARTSASSHISMKQAKALTDSAHFAARLGLPLNYHLTMHLSAEESATTDADAQRLRQQVFERARKWLQRRGYDLIAVWVLERSATLGLHCHMALHLSPEHAPAFRQKLFEWSDASNPRAIDLRRVGPPLWLDGLLRYMLKGSEEKVHERYGVPHDDMHNRRNQGTITVKRTGITTAINTKAQKNYKPELLAIAGARGTTLAYLLGRTRQAG